MVSESRIDYPERIGGEMNVNDAARQSLALARQLGPGWDENIQQRGGGFAPGVYSAYEGVWIYLDGTRYCAYMRVHEEYVYGYGSTPADAISDVGSSAEDIRDHFVAACNYVIHQMASLANQVRNSTDLSQAAVEEEE
jgi:hypothetical protein